MILRYLNHLYILVILFITHRPSTHSYTIHHYHVKTHHQHSPTVTSASSVPAGAVENTALNRPRMHCRRHCYHRYHCYRCHPHHCHRYCQHQRHGVSPPDASRQKASLAALSGHARRRRRFWPIVCSRFPDAVADPDADADADPDSICLW